MSSGPTAAVRTHADVLPDYILTKPPLPLLPTLEEELNRRYEIRYIDLRVRSKAMTFDEAADRAADFVRINRPFKPYSENFDRVVCTDATLTGLLLWTCLRMRHRKITIGQAENILLDHADDFYVIRSALLDLMGYTTEKKAPAVADDKPGLATAST